MEQSTPFDSLIVAVYGRGLQGFTHAIRMCSDQAPQGNVLDKHVSKEVQFMHFVEEAGLLDDLPEQETKPRLEFFINSNPEDFPGASLQELEKKPIYLEHVKTDELGKPVYAKVIEVQEKRRGATSKGKGTVPLLKNRIHILLMLDGAREFALIWT